MPVLQEEVTVVVLSNEPECPGSTHYQINISVEWIKCVFPMSRGGINVNADYHITNLFGE